MTTDAERQANAVERIIEREERDEMGRRIKSTRQAARARAKAWPLSAQGKRQQAFYERAFRVLAQRMSAADRARQDAFFEAMEKFGESLPMRPRVEVEHE